MLCVILHYPPHRDRFSHFLIPNWKRLRNMGGKLCIEGYLLRKREMESRNEDQLSNIFFPWVSPQYLLSTQTAFPGAWKKHRNRWMMRHLKDGFWGHQDISGFWTILNHHPALTWIWDETNIHSTYIHTHTHTQRHMHQFGDWIFPHSTA